MEGGFVCEQQVAHQAPNVLELIAEYRHFARSSQKVDGAAPMEREGSNYS